MVPFHLQGSPLSTVLPSSTAIYNLKKMHHKYIVWLHPIKLLFKLTEASYKWASNSKRVLVKYILIAMPNDYQSMNTLMSPKTFHSSSKKLIQFLITTLCPCPDQRAHELQGTSIYSSMTQVQKNYWIQWL